MEKAEEKERTYFCIDMKSFYASVECVERGLNPMEAKLVVADESRGGKTVCLAVSPSLKALGVAKRCRLNEVPRYAGLIVAKPRMKLYEIYSADIYRIFLDYVAPEDIHVYSVDEAFLDITDYLHGRRKEEFASMLINEVAKRKGIPATVGIGTNLYLAKIALDITAKHAPDGIGVLDTKTYIRKLWHHRPLTDFWQIARGTEKRLLKYGVKDMAGIVDLPEELLYKEFGVNAELLIDHAWGRESCTIKDIHAYKGKTKSLSSSQILPKNYDYLSARKVLGEMTLDLCRQLMIKGLITQSVTVIVGYASRLDGGVNGTSRLSVRTAVNSVISRHAYAVFDDVVDREKEIRRLGICFNGVLSNAFEGYDLLTDYQAIEKEKRAESAVLALKEKFGKNSVLRAVDLEEGATARERNLLIGGHNGGDE